MRRRLNGRNPWFGEVRLLRMWVIYPGYTQVSGGHGLNRDIDHFGWQKIIILFKYTGGGWSCICLNVNVQCCDFEW